MKMEKSSAVKVFEKYYQAIISSLPMRDPTFLTELQKHTLLSDHNKSVLETLKTSREMASYFVDNIIKPDLGKGVHTSFDELLATMLENSHDHVKELATVVKSELLANENKVFLGKFYTVP